MKSSAPASFGALVLHTAERLRERRTTLWIGEELSSLTLPLGRRFLRRLARLTLYALQPFFPELPSVESLVDRLDALGFELALSLADRTLGRELPLSLENPFDPERRRRPAWTELLNGAFIGAPGYVHRAAVALAREGYVARILTANQDELLETAASRIGYALPVVHAVEGDPIPEGVFKSYLFKLHGTLSRPDQWPLDMHRLHLACQSEAMFQLRQVLETHPLIVLGYRGPDPLDLWPLLSQSRLAHLIWADERPRANSVMRFPGMTDLASGETLEGDFPERLLSAHGGWRFHGRLNRFVDALCETLHVEVPGPPPDDEPTAIRELDDLPWPEGEEPPLAPTLKPLAETLRQSWLGPFALVTLLDLWSASAIDRSFVQRERLEMTLGQTSERAHFRLWLAQTGRASVEAAMLRHFHGLDVPPSDPVEIRRLTQAIDVLDLKGIPAREGALHPEEVDVEQRELRFALTGDASHLPRAAQVIAELPSVTHSERWLRLKAAGAVSRAQWAVAIMELSRALAEGGDTGSPLMKLRARVGIAGILHLLVRTGEPAALMGVLQALRRRDRGLVQQPFDASNCREVAAALALRTYDEVLERYAVVLPTLVPPLEPVANQFCSLALRAYRNDATRYLRDRKPQRGRSYSFIPDVECVIDQIVEG